MDTDAFVAVNSPAWDRLGQLTARRRLTAAEIDELIDLYQRTATHLSTVRSTVPDPSLTSRLSLLLARARGRILDSRTSSWGQVRTALLRDVPAAVHASRWGILVAAMIMLGSATLAAVVLTLDDPLRGMLVDEATQRRIAGGDFTAYYSTGPAASFAATVWTNNAWIAAQVIVFGVTGFWPVVVLALNGLNIGVMAAIMISHGQAATLAVFLLPHGLLELTCVAIAAGGGLRLFWSWLRPGPLPRSWALARASRALVTVVLALVPLLLLSGILEAFVTPSGLPAGVRMALGALVWAAVVVALGVLGRRAHREGVSGDLTEEVIGDTVAVAA